MLELGKVYKWTEIEQEYPNLWVCITDVKEVDEAIDTCRLLDVCTFENKSDYMKKYASMGIEFECQRTTFKAPNVGMLL